jgi:regulator of replication initiation timing
MNMDNIRRRETSPQRSTEEPMETDVRTSKSPKSGKTTPAKKSLSKTPGTPTDAPDTPLKRRTVRSEAQIEEAIEDILDRLDKQGENYDLATVKEGLTFLKAGGTIGDEAKHILIAQAIGRRKAEQGMHQLQKQLKQNENTIRNLKQQLKRAEIRALDKELENVDLEERLSQRARRDVPMEEEANIPGPGDIQMQDQFDQLAPSAAR